MPLLGLVAALLAASASPEAMTMAEVCPGEPPGGWSASDVVLREHVWARRQQAQAICLYMGSAYWADADPDRALRLYLLGMIRAQYEHGLCREWPRNEVSSFYAAMRGISGSALQDTESHTPDEVNGVLRHLAGTDDVLAYEPAMLEQLCGSAGGVRPRAEWPDVAVGLLSEVRASADEQ